MKQSHLRALQRVYLVLLFSFMYVPIAVMAVFSFNESKSRTIFTGFTFKWYQSLFHNEMILSALGLSLVVALIAAVVATVVGTAAAIGINAMGKRSQAVINNISYMPVVNPEIITGVSLMLLFVVAKDGIAWANQNLGWALPENIIMPVNTIRPKNRAPFNASVFLYLAFVCSPLTNTRNGMTMHAISAANNTIFVMISNLLFSCFILSVSYRERTPCRPLYRNG